MGKKKVSFKANSFIVLINYHCKKFEEKKVWGYKIDRLSEQIECYHFNLKTIWMREWHAIGCSIWVKSCEEPSLLTDIFMSNQAKWLNSEDDVHPVCEKWHSLTPILVWTSLRQKIHFCQGMKLVYLHIFLYAWRQHWPPLCKHGDALHKDLHSQTETLNSEGQTLLPHTLLDTCIWVFGPYP